MILKLYSHGMKQAENLLKSALNRRKRAGKESVERFDERLGLPSAERPQGNLLWLHAASVGEAQSALILVNTIRQKFPNIGVLVTTGTLTSANMMEKNLPDGAFHQFYPVDHPDWVERFLDHWQPNFIFWMESELWPNMLLSIKARDIPAILINARMSPRSLKRWSWFANSAGQVLSCFSHILCQTEQDAEAYQTLGAKNVTVTDNLKFSAAKLSSSDDDLKALSITLQRPCWVYASSHASEELLAARVHMVLKSSIPDILTVIVPRHPARRDDIKKDLGTLPVNVTFRGENNTLPNEDADIYVTDTLGELGLFYRACPIAFIGRSFSDDGGGGHNPIEAAQLHCAVLHGPKVQNLQEIFDDMNEAGAALLVETEDALRQKLHELLSAPEYLKEQQECASAFAKSKEQVLDRVMDVLNPYLEKLDLMKEAS